MKQQQTNKHSNLHREDQHITVEELWRGWKTSEGRSKGLSHALWTRCLTACLMFWFFLLLLLLLILLSSCSPQLDHGGHGAVAEGLCGAAAV